MIIIIGHTSDPHVVAVTTALEGSGHNYSILDITKSTAGGLVNNLMPGAAVAIGSGDINLEQVSALWWRQKPTPMPVSSVPGLYDHYFINREWNHVFDALLGERPDIFEINDRRKANAMNNKIAQLSLASASGFKVPPTLITNNPDKIIRFISQTGSGKCIFKTFTPYMPPSGDITFSTLIDAQLIMERREQISLAPGIFQEFVEKSYELRVTVVGQEIFTAKINSGLSDLGKVDWRQDQFAEIYEPFTLDVEFRGKLLNLHARTGLFYAAYDFIVDHSDCQVFLEVNPAGQWMWLELKLGFPISRRIADALSMASDERAAQKAL